MNCSRVQANLSLYLYGELDFVQEEELEEHLSSCALCQTALAREKGWHSNVNAERRDVPLDLLSLCRRDLRGSLGAQAKPVVPAKPVFAKWADALGLTRSAWPIRMAVASLLVFVGFFSGRFIDRYGLPGGFGAGLTAQMGILGPYTPHVRDIQQIGQNRVRIVIAEVREQEVTGSLEDEAVKPWLLAAAKDPTDAGIRVNSVEILESQSGEDVRNALLASVLHDPNEAVRLKALEGLRKFATEAAVRNTLKLVLERDDNPAMRSEAIDVLAPADYRASYSPDLARTLQEVMASEYEDDYVRSRCMQILSAMKPAAQPDEY